MLGGFIVILLNRFFNLLIYKSYSNLFLGFSTKKQRGQLSTL